MKQALESVDLPDIKETREKLREKGAQLAEISQAKARELAEALPDTEDFAQIKEKLASGSRSARARAASLLERLAGRLKSQDNGDRAEKPNEGTRKK